MQRGLFHNTDIGRSSFAKAIRLFALVSFATLGLSGCNNYEAVLQRLDYFVTPPPSPQKTVQVDFCTDPAVAEKTASKMVIILDHSGSNKLNYMMSPDGSGSPLVVGNQVTISQNLGTDANGVLRYGTLDTPGSLLHYLNNLPPNDPIEPLRYFALVNFASNASTYPAGSSGFTGNIPAFYNRVLSDARGGDPANLNGVPVDTGATSYVSALQETFKLIQADIAAAKACAALSTSAAPTMNCPTPGRIRASTYAIVMATDGAPVIETSGLSATGQVTGPLNLVRESNNEILSIVQSLVALTSDRKYVSGLNLFTVHYVSPNNNVDNTARTLLAEMARVGNGIPYVSVTGSSIDFTRFQPPAKLIKYLLSDLFVSNTTGVWSSNGTFVADNDGDGISNVDELAWGSNPNSRDSNGNDINDKVEFHLRNGAACLNKNASGVCTDAAINYRANTSSPCYSVSFSGGRYRASDPSGLNDCEKILLNNNGGINNPDSNNDGLPDWLAFKNDVPFQIGSAPSYLSTLSDGYNQYQKVKLSMPVQIPVNMLLGYQPTNYALTQISNNSSQSCYQLKVTNLPLLGNDDRIKVEIIQRSELLQDRFLYRSAERRFVVGQDRVEFKDWKDPAEIAAGTWRAWP